MAYVETICDPVDGDTIPTGSYSVRQYYDDIWMESPYFSPKFYLDGDLIGFCGENYTENYAARSYTFTIETDYTWRIDIYNNESNEWQTGTTHNLTVSNTPPLPGKPINPTPEHLASDVTLHDTTGVWESGGNTDSYNVYYGTLSGFLELVESGVTELSLVLVEGNFSVYGKISYWRVDAVNAQGITQGDEWIFTTMNFAPVLPTGVTLDHSGGEGGVPTGTPTGENNIMTIRRLVVAANDKIWYEDL